MKQMTEYRFYGWETADVLPTDSEWSFVGNPREFYDLLCKYWSMETCAPRMREEWSPENRTLGQCSVTAFLAQDIYGGTVMGIPLGDGNYHCFNVVGDRVFDLTSEQFGDRKLDYVNTKEQIREEHFTKKEKEERYGVLKARLRGSRREQSPQSAS